MKVNFKQARNFLERINERDRVIIFVHNDLDGFASGVMLYNFCKKKKAKVSLKIISIGLSKISDTNLKKFNKILIADLSPSNVSGDLKNLGDKEVFYTDHHQEENGSVTLRFVLEYRTLSKGYIPSSRTCFELTMKENGGLEWLGVCGVIADAGHKYKENGLFLESFYKKNNTNFEEMLKLTMLINYSIIYFNANCKSFLKLLKVKSMEDVSLFRKYSSKVEKSLGDIKREFGEKKSVIGKINYYYVKKPLKFPLLKSYLSSDLSFDSPEKIIIVGIDKDKDTVGFSIRNSSRAYDVSLILKKAVSGLENSSAGGHKSASGGQILKKDLNLFEDNLKKIDIERYRINDGKS